VTLEEMLREWPAGEQATNTTITYTFSLPGDLGEESVHSEVRRRFPAFRKAHADHYEERCGRPSHWLIGVTLRKEW
jgi:hypothetical protein